ncbi:hypothetical protein K7432_004521, partial [Basidiobolus ranarum]
MQTPNTTGQPANYDQYYSPSANAQYYSYYYPQQYPAAPGTEYSEAAGTPQYSYQAAPVSSTTTTSATTATVASAWPQGSHQTYEGQQYLYPTDYSQSMYYSNQSYAQYQAPATTTAVYQGQP